MAKTLSILGSTGSIGESTLKVVDAYASRFEVQLLAGGRRRDVLLRQIQTYRPKLATVLLEEDAAWLRSQLGSSRTQILHGEAGLLEAIGLAGSDFTLAAIVGAAGLLPTMEAIRHKSHIGLANKEAMVVAGTFMKRAAREQGVALLPVDSEHNALHQCLAGIRPAFVKRLILTASGGPFRNYHGDFESIKPSQALRHPTWDMGRKITIDSATMMNKGLEVIEAHHLFDMPPEKIDTVVHPQSIVHSMVETIDGSYLAQMGKTDMVHPIMYAMTYPERWDCPFENIDLTQDIQLDFQATDLQKFPCIQLAYDALAMGDAAPCVLNAANELAVYAFLEEKISFTDIPRLNRQCMHDLGTTSVSSLEDLIDLDHESRRHMAQLLDRVS